MTVSTPGPDLEDYMGKRQPPYASAGQAQIGQMLDTYGIPFFYRQPTLICCDGRRRIWHPDFTLPTYDNMVVQYDRGQTTTPGPWPSRESDIYKHNGMAALILAPSDLTGSHWPQRLYDRLEELYSRPWAHRCSVER